MYRAISCLPHFVPSSSLYHPSFLFLGDPNLICSLFTHFFLLSQTSSCLLKNWIVWCTPIFMAQEGRPSLINSRKRLHRCNFIIFFFVSLSPLPRLFIFSHTLTFRRKYLPQKSRWSVSGACTRMRIRSPPRPHLLFLLIAPVQSLPLTRLP